MFLKQLFPCGPMGKVQKIGKWVPHELNDRQMERRQTHAKFCLPDKKESRSCIGF